MGKVLSDGFEKQLRDVVKWWRGQSQFSSNLNTETREPQEINVFRNNSGEEVPAYAIMEVEDVEVGNGRNVLVIKKPTGDASKPHVVNGPRAVATAKKGRWQWGTVKVAVTGTPTAGAEWGVSSGSWVLSSGGSAIMRMMGELATGFAMGQPLGGGSGSAICLASANAAFTTASSTVSVTIQEVLQGSGSGTVTAYNPLAVDGVAGTYAWGGAEDTNMWIIYSSENSQWHIMNIVPTECDCSV